jgi:hypothetical protein
MQGYMCLFELYIITSVFEDQLRRGLFLQVSLLFFFPQVFRPCKYTPRHVSSPAIGPFYEVAGQTSSHSQNSGHPSSLNNINSHLLQLSF